MLSVFLLLGGCMLIGTIISVFMVNKLDQMENQFKNNNHN